MQMFALTKTIEIKVSMLSIDLTKTFRLFYSYTIDFTQLKCLYQINKNNLRHYKQ